MPEDVQRSKVAFATIDDPAPSGADRRRSRRYLCAGFAEIQLIARDMIFRGEICNLSLHGCFVTTRARVQLEKVTPVMIRFNLRNRQFKTEGLVVNLRPGEGFGIQFHHATPETVDEFMKLVEDYENAAPRRR